MRSGRESGSPAVPIVAVAVLACAETNDLTLPEIDCSRPWLQLPPSGTVHFIGGPPDYYLYESDLPYELAADGIMADDRVTVRPASWPPRMTAYQDGGAWMIGIEPDANWYNQDHSTELLDASRPGCTETHAAVLLLFRGDRPDS